MRRIILLASLGVALLAGRARADAIDDIRQRGHLVCEVSEDADDYSPFDAHGDLAAFGTAYCRAYAAAILGDTKRADIHVESDEITGLSAVRDGHADIMVGSTPEPAFALAMHLAFAPPILIDGQGFLLDPAFGAHRLTDLSNARICFLGARPAAGTLVERMGQLGIAFTPFEQSEQGEMEGALATNHCNAITGDVTELANARLSLPALRPFVILPETITTDPLAPAIHDGERRLMAVVTAVDDGLVQAEEFGVTRPNAAQLADHSHDPIIRRLLGADGWIGPSIGLDDLWLRRVIEAVGNHAEIYRRDVGEGSKLRLPVGSNAPASAGGALAPVPVEIAR